MPTRKPPCRTLRIESEMDGLSRLIQEPLFEALEVITLPEAGWIIKQKERL